MAAPFAPLARSRNFRLFFVGQLVSLIGSWMQNAAQGWLVVLLATQIVGASHAEKAANGYLGIVAAAGSLPVLFFALYGGALADRVSKRDIIVWAQTAQAVIALALAALVHSGQVRIWQVIVAAALVGITNVFDIPARQSFVVEMVGKEDLAGAIALNSSIFNAARALGPAVTGFLIGLSGSKNPQQETQTLALCFLVNGLSYIAVIAGLLAMRPDELRSPPRRTSTEPLRVQLLAVGAYLRDHRATLLLVCLVAWFSVFNAPSFVLLPTYARFTLGADGRGYGLVVACPGAGALLAALGLATLGEWPHRGRVITLAGLVFPLAYIALALVRSPFVAAPLLVIGGAGTITFLATANTLLQTSTPDNLRGRMMGLYSVLLMGLTPVGSLWSSALAQVVPGGAATTIGVGAAITGAAMLVAALRYPAFGRAGLSLPESL